MSWPVALEKRSNPSPWLLYLLPAVALGLALLLGALVLACVGTHPGEAYREMARGAFGSAYSLSETLVKATPLLLAGLGVGVAFRAGVWNIGAEGQLYMGAMGGTWIALTYSTLPVLLLQPLMIVVGCLAGAFWGLIVLGLWVFLYRTRPGLKVRAVGEQPRSADAVGINVAAVRYSCVLAGGLAAGLGGAYLSLAYTHMWVDTMTAGRGWVALAMVIFGGWNPLGTALGAYLFGGVQALQLRLQAIGLAVPTYVLMMTPYAFTILALLIASSRKARGPSDMPAALGKAYIRGE